MKLTVAFPVDEILNEIVISNSFLTAKHIVIVEIDQKNFFYHLKEIYDKDEFKCLEDLIDILTSSKVNVLASPSEKDKYIANTCLISFIKIKGKKPLKEIIDEFFFLRK